MHLNGETFLNVILSESLAGKWAAGLKFNDSEKNGPQGLICF